MEIKQNSNNYSCLVRKTIDLSLMTVGLGSLLALSSLWALKSHGFYITQPGPPAVVICEDVLGKEHMDRYDWSNRK